MPANTDAIAPAFALLSGLMPVGVMLLDGAGRLAAANARACALLGCADEADLKRRWPGIRAGLDPARFAHQGKPVRFITALQDLLPAAPRRSLRLELHSLDAGPSPPLLVLLKERDSLDALDTRLLAALRMRNEAFLRAAVSHEVRRPLNAMFITLDLLRGRLAEPAAVGDDARSGSERRYAAVLGEELARLNELLGDGARLGVASAAGEEAFDLRELLRDIAAPLEQQARRQSVALRIALPERAVPLHAAEERLRQALLGIAINALEAMPDGGAMSIALGVGATTAELCVADGGPPMSEKLLDDAYALCFSPAMSDAALALYVARMVAESCGGELLIDRQPDKGMRVRLTLPLSR